MIDVAFIFARGGSKGLPHKNIKILNGKPLIAWSIEAAFKLEGISRVIVSTDSVDIANIALKYNATIDQLRPYELSQDDSPEYLAWRYELTKYSAKYGYMPSALLSLPATSPLRNVKDVASCIELFRKNDFDAVITVTEPYRNPYFNMLTKNKEGLMEVVCKNQHPIHRRQDAPEVFDMATVAYVVSTSHIFSSERIMSGRIASVLVSRESAIDIDTIEDFRYAEYVLNKNNENGK